MLNFRLCGFGEEDSNAFQVYVKSRRYWGWASFDPGHDLNKLSRGLLDTSSV